VNESGDALKKQNTEYENKFLRLLEEGLLLKKFDLQNELSNETIGTCRTVGATKAWEGTWPALREFFQNTVDHLKLYDYATGRRNKVVDLEICYPGNPAATHGDEKEKDKNNGIDLAAAAQGPSHDSQIPLVVFSFTCGDEVLCNIVVMSNDELVIEQAYTFPLSRMALYTGVRDDTKHNGTTAGGSYIRPLLFCTHKHYVITLSNVDKCYKYMCMHGIFSHQQHPHHRFWRWFQNRCYQFDCR
jgi:hypothetical protein